MTPSPSLTLTNLCLSHETGSTNGEVVVWRCTPQTKTFARALVIPLVGGTKWWWNEVVDVDEVVDGTKWFVWTKWLVEQSGSCGRSGWWNKVVRVDEVVGVDEVVRVDKVVGGTKWFVWTKWLVWTKWFV